MNGLDRSVVGDDGQAGGASLVSFLINGGQPNMPPPAPGAVHRHSLDDGPGRAKSVPPATAAAAQQSPRDFTAGDKALIRRVHAYMNPLQLLGVLNTRLTCDLGDGAVLYTVEQLRAEIAGVTSAMPAAGTGWGALRKLLANARRNGVLEKIDEQRIDDFAVVFSLTQKQVISLKDILLAAEEDDEE